MWKSLLPKEVKVDISFDDVRLKSILTTTKTAKFTEKSFFYIIIGFTQSHSGELDDIERLVQLIPGTYKSDKPVNFKRIDKYLLKCDCIQENILNGTREHILDSFALSASPGHRIFEEPKIELFKMINKPILSHTTFYLEDDDHNPVDFKR